MAQIPDNVIEEILAKAAPCGILEEYLKLAGLPVEEKKDQSGC